MNTKALIIHLKRATDRRPQVDRLKKQCPLPAEVIDAVDGEILDAETVRSTYHRSIHEPHYPFELRTAETACFLSHRKCWQTILDQNLDAALILEDDVELDDPVFRDALKLASQHFTCDDFVRFPAKRREVAAATRAATASHELIVPRVAGVGMVGQLVGKGAARTLLETTQIFDRPVDSFLQMAWITGVWPTSVYPSGISEKSAQLGGSRISKQKSWSETLRREILRPWYRWKLATLVTSHNPAIKKAIAPNAPEI